jgi:hypothetical protein
MPEGFNLKMSLIKLFPSFFLPRGRRMGFWLDVKLFLDLD